MTWRSKGAGAGTCPYVGWRCKQPAIDAHRPEWQDFAPVRSRRGAKGGETNGATPTARSGGGVIGRVQKRRGRDWPELSCACGVQLCSQNSKARIGTASTRQTASPRTALPPLVAPHAPCVASPRAFPPEQSPRTPTRPRPPQSADNGGIGDYASS
jgi:hypothetical protein